MFQFIQLLFIALATSTPTRRRRDYGPTHGETFSQNVVGGTGLGVGLSVGTMAVNGIAGLFHRDRRPKDEPVPVAADSAAAGPVAGCVPGQIVSLQTPEGPKQAIFTTDCSIAQLS